MGLSTKLTLLERRLRIVTGLILSVYIIVHLSNHALGLISFEAMESMRKVVTPFWRIREFQDTSSDTLARLIAKPLTVNVEAAPAA